MEPQERVKGLSEMCFTVSKWDGRAGAGNKHTHTASAWQSQIPHVALLINGWCL